MSENLFLPTALTTFKVFARKCRSRSVLRGSYAGGIPSEHTFLIRPIVRRKDSADEDFYSRQTTSENQFLRDR